MELYITRHGESTGNVRNEGGVSIADTLGEDERENPHLTALGRRQAFLLGQRLAPCDFDAVIVSPLIRAVETAYELVRQQSGKSAYRVEIMPELMEAGTREGYMGSSAEQIAAEFSELDFRFIQTEKPIYPSALEKDKRERLKRAENIIEYIKKRFCGGESVMLVAHGTFNHSLTMAACGLPYVEDFNFCSENTGLTKLRYFEDGRTRLSYSDDLSHLIPEFPHHTFSL